MIIIVGGNKGGVGKSFVAKAVFHYLSMFDDNIAVIDGDVSNLDVFKSAHKEGEKTAAKPGIILPKTQADKNWQMDLASAKGWEDLLTYLDYARPPHAVINTAGGSGEGLQKNSGRLSEKDLEDFGQKLITAWPINRNRDSLIALNAYLNQFPWRVVVTVLNGYFGSEADYERYYDSGLQERVKKSGGCDVYISSLSDRAADAIYDERLMFSEAETSQKIKRGPRSSIREWLVNNEAAFNKILALGAATQPSDQTQGKKPKNEVEAAI